MCVWCWCIRSPRVHHIWARGPQGPLARLSPPHQNTDVNSCELTSVTRYTKIVLLMLVVRHIRGESRARGPWGPLAQIWCTRGERIHHNESDDEVSERLGDCGCNYLMDQMTDVRSCGCNYLMDQMTDVSSRSRPLPSSKAN